MLPYLNTFEEKERSAVQAPVQPKKRQKRAVFRISAGNESWGSNRAVAQAGESVATVRRPARGESRLLSNSQADGLAQLG